MPSLNESIRDRVIRHAIALNRYERGLVAQMLKLLDEDLEPALVEKLASRLARTASRGPGVGVQTTANLREMVAAIQQLIHDVSLKAKGGLQRELKALAKAEARWQKSMIEGEFPVPIEVKLPAPAVLSQIVTEQTFNGALLKDWFRSFEVSTLAKVTKSTNLGLAAGETPDQIIRRITGTAKSGYTDGQLELTRREASVLVRTASAHTFQAASSETAAANADIIKGEVWTATLDTRTCPVCGELDGQTFPLGEGPTTPAHPNCRCFRVAVTKSYKELGIPLKDLEPAARASMDGLVPGKTTFESWLATRDFDDVAEILGSKAAAKAYFADEVELSDFSTSWGAPLSLKAAMAGK